MDHLKKIAKPREILLAAALTLCVVVVLFRVYYPPQSKKLQMLKGQVHALKIDKKSLEKKAQVLAQQKKKKQVSVKISANPKIQILKGDIPPQVSKIASFVELLTSSKFLQGMTLLSVSSHSPSDQSGYLRLPVSLKTRGPFDLVISLIRNIETVEALAVINSVFIESSDLVKGEVNLNMTVSLYQVEGIHASKTKK